jgi:hypothetical protein
MITSVRSLSGGSCAIIASDEVARAFRPPTTIVVAAVAAVVFRKERRFIGALGSRFGCFWGRDQGTGNRDQG